MVKDFSYFENEGQKMKKFGLVLAVAFFLSIGLSAAYADQKDSKANPPSQEVKKEGKEVASAKDTSMTKEKEDYQKSIKGELNAYKKKMKQLEAKAKDLKDKAKEEAKEEMAEVHKKMNSAEEKLKAMKSASGEAWEKAKSEVDSAVESVKENYEKVVAHFK